MKKYLFLSVLIFSLFSAFQGVSQAITVTASPSAARVNQTVTITITSGYAVLTASPNCTLAVDFGDGSPWSALTVCTTVSCIRTVTHTYTTPGQYTISAQSLADACATPPIAPNPATTTLTVSCTPLAIISPAALPSGTVGTSYSYQIQASGGQTPYAFSVNSGILPPGLEMSSSGRITGVPSTAGAFNFATKVTDSCPTGIQTQRQSFSLTIGCTPINITSPATLPSGTTGQAFSYQLQTSGGVPPVIFSLSSGSLPPGLSLAQSGLISGTLTAAGTFNFAITATDSCAIQSQTTQKTFSMTGTPALCPALSISSPAALPSGDAGQPYSQPIIATGGQAPISFALSSGSLPPGLALNASGLVSGTPVAAGAYRFSITAADSCPASIQQVQQSFSMVVSANIRVTVSPSLSKIPRNMVSTHNIVYAFSNASTAAMALTSDKGTYIANTQVIGEVLTPLTVALANGAGKISEALTVPVSIALRAEQAGTSRILYTRTFTSGDLRVTAQMELIAGTEAAAEFTINRLQLYFENQRAEITVGRNQPGLKAFADIRFTGSGLLTGYWEVDGRILEYVNQHLVYGKTVTLSTPDVPPLPTFSPGTHLVRFVVTQPAADIPTPQAIYFITSKESGQIRAIDLTLPEDQSQIPYKPVHFEWQSVALAETYLILFFAETDEKPVFSAYTRKTIYQLPSLIFTNQFARDKTYHWQVKGYDADGNVLGESAVYGFGFSK